MKKSTLIKFTLLTMILLMFSGIAIAQDDYGRISNVDTSTMTYGGLAQQGLFSSFFSFIGITDTARLQSKAGCSFVKEIDFTAGTSAPIAYGNIAAANPSVTKWEVGNQCAVGQYIETYFYKSGEYYKRIYGQHFLKESDTDRVQVYPNSDIPADAKIFYDCVTCETPVATTTCPAPAYIQNADGTECKGFDKCSGAVPTGYLEVDTCERTDILTPRLEFLRIGTVSYTPKLLDTSDLSIPVTIKNNGAGGRLWLAVSVSKSAVSPFAFLALANNYCDSLAGKYLLTIGAEEQTTIIITAPFVGSNQLTAGTYTANLGVLKDAADCSFTPAKYATFTVAGTPVNDNTNNGLTGTGSGTGETDIPADTSGSNTGGTTENISLNFAQTPIKLSQLDGSTNDQLAAAACTLNTQCIGYKADSDEVLCKSAGYLVDNGYIPQKKVDTFKITLRGAIIGGVTGIGIVAATTLGESAWGLCGVTLPACIALGTVGITTGALFGDWFAGFKQDFFTQGGFCVSQPNVVDSFLEPVRKLLPLEWQPYTLIIIIGAILLLLMILAGRRRQ